MNKKIILGILTILILTSGAIYLTFGNDVKMRIDNDKSTFYVFNDNSRWEVSGREYNNIFDGTSKMNRDVSNIKIDTTYDGNEVTIKRTTPYKRGPVIVDTYTFDGDIEDIELFPISHQVEIFNGSGFFYRYEVRELEYSGETKKLEGETSLSFGKNMKVDIAPDYRWAWVYSSGIVKAQYDLDTDYETFNVRFFDPPEDIDSNFTSDGSGFANEVDGIKTKINADGNFSVSKWDDEVVLNISKPNIFPGLSASNPNSEGSGKISVSSTNVGIKWYMKNVSGINAFEYEVILKSKPTTNIISWEISTKDLTFYYQPPMNERGYSNYTICNETYCNPNGLIMEMDSNIVGSYAVYSSKKHNKYGTGKVLHFLRPYVIDSKGTKTWAYLNIDQGIMTITIPQEVIDKGIYPLIVDPTIGYTTMGATARSAGDLVTYYKITMTETGTLTHITSGTSSYESPTVYHAIYSDSSGVNSKLEEETTGYTAGNWGSGVFHELSIAGTTSLNDATTYWLAVVADSDTEGGFRIWGDYVSWHLDNSFTEAGTTFPATATPGGTSIRDFEVSIFANYTTGGGDDSPVVSLTAPPDNTANTSTSFTFQCNVTDDFNITNTTLYIWNSTGVWNNTEINTSTGTSLNYTFPVSGFTVENYTWNCYACDDATSTQCAWADNNFSLNVTAPDVNYTSNIGNIRFLNCSPDWEHYPSLPSGQTETNSAINVSNNGTQSGDFQIEYTGSINTGWTLFACNATSASDPQADSTNCLTLSDSWQTIWSAVDIGLNKSIWLYANCSNVSANPGVPIAIQAIP